MQILYDNKLSDCTVTAATENPDYPLTNFNESRLSGVYRSVNSDDQWIKMSGPVTASRIVIAGHNLSVDAMIRIQGNNTDSWTSPSLNSLVTRKAGIITKQFTEVTYNYYRLFIDDAESNASDYIEIGGLYIGTYLQLPGMKIDQTSSYNTTSTGTVSKSGHLFGSSGIKYREFTVNFPSISNSQRDDIIEWWETVENITPFYMIPWANREDLEKPMYCFINQDGIDFKRSDNYAVPWSTTIKFREVF